MALLIGGFIQFLRGLRNSDPSTGKNYLFFLFLLLTTILQILVTRQAIYGWHIFNIYPWLAVLIGHSIIEIVNAFSKRRYVRIFLLSVLLGFISCYQVIVDLYYLRSYEEPAKSVAWSQEIYQLLDFTKSDPHAFVSVDWGTHNQLVTFNRQKGKYIEIAYILNQDSIDKKQSEWIKTEILNPNNSYALIMHSESETRFTTARKNIFAIANEVNINLSLAKRILDENSRIIFEIYIPKKRS